MTDSIIASPPFSLQTSFTQSFPGEAEVDPSPRQTPGMLWAAAAPSEVSQPRLLGYFSEVADQLGLSAKQMQHPDTLALLSGNSWFAQQPPFSVCYGGHQFGHWAGQLGDGRAITVAEVAYQQQRYDLQLKGAGMTPYSRSADGRAVLRSSIREFLCSEAMHHLGIPTTRALSLVLTGDQVVRDMFYDGRPEAEPGAIVMRVASSFTRFGNFEILAARKETELLKQLIAFTIQRDFPELDSNASTITWFHEVCQRTAQLIVEWHRVGFVHGVMNTDNMSITGLTIDYGPYGWLDAYDPNWTPNTTDAQQGRYRFKHQPAIARWNLAALANALANVEQDHDGLRQGIELFDQTLNQQMQTMQLAKFGLSESSEREQALEFIDRSYLLMQITELDFTQFFDLLSEQPPQNLDVQQLAAISYAKEADNHQDRWIEWSLDYRKLIKLQNLDWQVRQSSMRAVNPVFTLRNFITQQAIDAATNGDYELLHRLMERLKTPYSVSGEDQAWGQKRPAWADNKPGCSALSCSS